MTQTDMRILSEEMDRLLKCIDEARTIISPTEKFVFRRYRQAMEGKRLLGGEKINGLEGGMDAVRGGGAVSDNLEGPSSNFMMMVTTLARKQMNNKIQTRHYSILMEEYWKINVTAPLKYVPMGTSR